MATATSLSATSNQLSRDDSDFAALFAAAGDAFRGDDYDVLAFVLKCSRAEVALLGAPTPNGIRAN